MARIKYQDWNPGLAARRIIQIAEQIAADYQSQGYDLTLRQLYYQFVARGYIANSQAEYNKLGNVLNKARLAGLFDWDYITDRTRELKSIGHFRSPADVMRAAARSFHQDLWRNQPTRVEVWVEKEALAGVIGQVADRHDCAYFACRGYVSASEMWGAAQRIGAYVRTGQNVVVLHLGDHDPSGIDMTRDITDRLELMISHDNGVAAVRKFIGEHQAVLEGLSDANRKVTIHDGAMEILRAYGSFEIRRIALNMDQVEQYDPPPNPAKLTDSRVDNYIAEYGDSSWELDALDPAVLDALIEEHIEQEKDHVIWYEDFEEQETHRALVQSASDNWSEVAEFVGAL